MLYKVVKNNFHIIIFLLCAVGLPNARSQSAEFAADEERQSPGQRPTAPPPVTGKSSLQQPGVNPAVSLRIGESKSERIWVFRFETSPTRLLAPELIQQALSPFVNQKLTFAELETAVAKIPALYVRYGLLASAELPAQEVLNGVVRVDITEANLSAVEVQKVNPQQRADTQYARKVVERLNSLGEPVRSKSIEEALLRISDLPGYSASGVLARGTNPGDTNLLVRVADAPLIVGNVTLNNQGYENTGKNKVDSNISLNNLLGQAESFGLGASFTEGSSYGRLDADLPVGYAGWALGASLSTFHYSVGDGFGNAGAGGTADTRSLRATWTVVRSEQASLRTSLRYDHREYHNNVSGSSISDKTLDVPALEISGWRMDTVSANQARGSVSAVLGVAWGVLDLGGNPADLAADSATTRKQGGYTKLYGNLVRLQPLGQWLLRASGSAQFSSTNLDSAEKLSLGGPNGVRAYPVGEASGDQGFILNLDLSRNIGRGWELGGFIDYGEIQVNRNLWTGWNYGTPNASNQYHLSAAGLSLTWSDPGGLQLRASAAQALENNPGASNPGDKPGNVWFSLFVPF